MRHSLYLVQKHYTEPRLLTVQGRRGPKLIHGFKGAQLNGQANVTVLPGSLAPRTREQIVQQVIAYADRGWIDPDAAMIAIDQGTAEGLMESLEADEGRANEIIQSIEDETFFDQPDRPVFPGEDPGIDPETMQIAMTVPGWMPRPFDRVPIHKTVFEDLMKSAEWSVFNDEQKQATLAYYSELLAIEEMQALKAMQAQEAQAEGLGMANASKPSKAKPLPDQSSPSNGKGGAQAQIFGARYKAGSTTNF